MYKPSSYDFKFWYPHDYMDTSISTSTVLTGGIWDNCMETPNICINPPIIYNVNSIFYYKPSNYDFGTPIYILGYCRNSYYKQL